MKAREALGSDAEYHDVLEDGFRLMEMLGYSKGRREVPVIVEGEKVTIGYAGDS